MRSAAEIKFRLRQEAANLYLLVAQPGFGGRGPGLLALPDGRECAAELCGSLFQAKLLATAESIMAHRFPLMGVTVETGARIDWRRDYAHNKTSPSKYFRLVPYLDFEAVGDHKFIWELNRHQHLVLLAQAHLLTGKLEYLRELFEQLQSWFEQNPFQRGINWASALEVAFRALSWIWIWHFCSADMPAALRERFLKSLYQHGRHLFENLSLYFSPNTHLLGEGVALHALGKLFPAFPEAENWRRRGAGVVEEQLIFQVKPDGSHFEQSTYYHVYALDFFVFHYLLAGKPARLKQTLERMAEYLHWLLGPARRITFFGDDDGGRLFHPQGERDEFGRATLATCGILLNREEWVGTRDELAEQAAWWVGAEALAHSREEASGLTAGSKLFPDAGAVFLQSRELYVQFDAGPFGWGSGGHSHADTLSLVAWHRGEAVFTDPGTFTYLGNPRERDHFRGTRAHNTVAINGRDQAKAAGPFRWLSKPAVQLQSFEPSGEGGVIAAVCEYGGFRHRRRARLHEGQLIVLDDIEGPAGEHLVEQIWNLGSAAGKIHLSFSDPGAVKETTAEFSSAYGSKRDSPALIARREGALPFAMAVCLDTRRKVDLTVAEARRIFDNKGLIDS